MGFLIGLIIGGIIGIFIMALFQINNQDIN